MSDTIPVSKTVDSAPPNVSKWLIATCVMCGAFMAVMDVNVVNVSLPHMMGKFGQDMSSITWVATSYSIAEIIMITMAGWWSTLLGRKRFYLWSFGLFTFSSILCGMAQTFPQMLTFRVMQGIGGGALIPVSQAILFETFPEEEQAMAMGVFGMGVVLAPAIGPVIGGWLTDHYGWPWIFYINIPVSILGIFLVGTFVKDPSYLRRGVKKIDWIGIFLLTVFLTGMQIILERGQSENWFESQLITTGTLVSVAAALLMVWWELKTDEPIINLRLLRNVPLALGSSMGIVFGIALFGTTFILPQFTQELLGYSALHSGLVLAPRAAMIMAFMLIVGRLYRNFDAKILMLFGVAMVFWSYHDLARLSLDVGFQDLVPIMIIMGIGLPFNFVPIATVSMSTVPRIFMTDATSMYTLSRRVGGNIGYALVATMVARGQQIHRVDLVAHVTANNPNMAPYDNVGNTLFAHSGIGSVALPKAKLALVDGIVNHHATMLSYNDASWIFGFLFLSTIPFILFLPSRSALKTRIREQRNR